MRMMDGRVEMFLSVSCFKMPNITLRYYVVCGHFSPVCSEFFLIEKIVSISCFVNLVVFIHSTYIWQRDRCIISDIVVCRKYSDKEWLLLVRKQRLFAWCSQKCLAELQKRSPRTPHKREGSFSLEEIGIVNNMFTQPAVVQSESWLESQRMLSYGKNEGESKGNGNFTVDRTRSFMEKTDYLKQDRNK